MFCKDIKINTKDSSYYSNEIGYGLIDPFSIQKVSETDSDAALKCGGWNCRRLERSDANSCEISENNNSNVCNQSEIKNTSDTAAIKNRSVTIVRIDVPEFGTYKTTVSISAEEGADNLTLFAGRRNMIADRFSVKRGRNFEISFYQAVTPYIPALRSERCEDKCIFISVSGSDELALDISIEKEDVPVIWVAGDSTLTDQNAGIPYNPYGSCSGWAQTLSRFIKGAAVCNLSHSGMTSNCFRDDGHYDIVKEMIKPGDFFIMQFGHNDQKRRNLSAFGGYKENLKKYVSEVRNFGATPIICSPISRIPLELSAEKSASKSMPYVFTEDKDKSESIAYYSLLSSYARACEEAAKETDTLFIDLHKLTFDKWVSDIDAAKDFFMPGDITHTNEYGSVLISGFFIDEIRRKALCNADNNTVKEKASLQYNAACIFEKFDNQNKIIEHLPSDDTKLLPKELPGPDIFSLEPPYVDIQGIDEYDDIKKAFKYGLLDPCVMYLHPYATMPRAQLLMVMFKAFRIPGVRPYVGTFKDIVYDEWDSGYVQALINENLIDTNTDLFRPDDALTYSEFAAFLVRFLEPDHEKRLALSFEECLKKAKKLGITANATKANAPEMHKTLASSEKYELAAGDKITRAEVYSALARCIDIIGAANDALPSDAEVNPVH